MRWQSRRLAAVLSLAAFFIYLSADARAQQGGKPRDSGDTSDSNPRPANQFTPPHPSWRSNRYDDTPWAYRRHPAFTDGNGYDRAYGLDDEYGGANPYGNPYGNRFGNPYGSPYGNPYGNAYGNPYGNPNGNPYGNPRGNPYGFSGRWHSFGERHWGSLPPTPGSYGYSLYGDFNGYR